MAGAQHRVAEAVPQHDAVLRHLLRAPPSRFAGDEEIEYIAPDLLPERGDLERKLEQWWELDSPTETATFSYPMLHPGLMRSIISAIGSE